MISNLRITILVDDEAGKPKLINEHGLSLWIEADEHKILFDTGQSGIFIENAASIGIDVSSTEILIFSHGHYDHTNGTSTLLNRCKLNKIFCHPDIFSPRYSKHSDGSMKFIGINSEVSEELHNVADIIHYVNEPTLVSKDIGITGPIPRNSAFEDCGGSFFLDKEGKKPDLILDDVALWIRTKKGIVVVTGCCHSGVINTIEYIIKITGEREIFAIVGGLHLLNASSERIKKTGEYLKTKVIERIYPCHCTGENAIELLKRELTDDKIQNGWNTLSF